MDPVLLIIIAATCIISYVAFSNHELFDKYKFNVGAILQKKEYIRLLSAGFLHADFMHLLLNMYVLYMFSPPIFATFGTIGFLVIIFPSDFAPHTQYGKSGGHVHFPFASNIAFFACFQPLAFAKASNLAP